MIIIFQVTEIYIQSSDIAPKDGRKVPNRSPQSWIIWNFLNILPLFSQKGIEILAKMFSLLGMFAFIFVKLCNDFAQFHQT